MIPWWWAIPIAITFTFVGWALCALCCASSDAEENQPKPNDKKGI